MIQPSIMCNSRVFDASFLTLKQLSILIVANFIFMAASIFINALVIYILIKEKPMSQITYKLIFVLSASDMLIGILPQSLITAIFFGAPCSFYEALTIFTTFLSHTSNYRIAYKCLALIAILESNIMQLLEPCGPQRLYQN